MSYNIFHVIRDFVLGRLVKAPKNIQAERLELCNDCAANSAGLCTACGCVIKLKVKMAKSSCPMMQWHEL